VTYSKRVNNIWSSTKTPESLSNGFSNLAWYVRSFFDHVDTENSETTKFKNAFFSTIFTILFLAYLFVGWDKAWGIMTVLEISTSWMYLLHGITIILGIILLYVIYRKILHTRDTLIRVMTNMDRMMNQKKSQKVLTNLFFVAIFFVSALFFPLVLYLAGLPAWTNYICFVLLGVSFVYFKFTSRILSTYKTSNYATGKLYNTIKLQDLYKPKKN
ncbi:MAG: hypothetical protein WC254_07145, partial [Candidatus Woesearchaeota archaeon]